jgi:DNA topoisomerase-3
MAQLGKIVVIAEKPSVARDLAKILGAFNRGNGFFHGSGYTVTWAIGHLVTLPEPHQINVAWKTWRFAHLPMLPAQWPLVAVEKTRTQFEIVRDILSDCDEVICATDAGREGELIFRYIYELSRCTKPVKRLWISSLTPDAIQAGLRNLKSASQYDSLADAARARSRADWLYGMNLSRAYAITTNDQLFVGRVQTPTLAMVVDRDLKILNFISEKYVVIEGEFQVPDGKYKGAYIGEKKEISNPTSALEIRLTKPPEEIQLILERIRKGIDGSLTGQARVLSLTGKTTKLPPPLLYDLTELQRHCNRLFGFSASQTLSLAQNLYEEHKLISYPRTGSRHLSNSVAETLPEIIDIIRSPYEPMLAEGTGQKKRLSSRFVDDSKVTDHHAIIPTATRRESGSARSRLSLDEEKIYDLICRRLLMAWHNDFVTSITTLITEVGSLDLFKTQGTVVVDQGWKALDLKSKNMTQDAILPQGLFPGVPVEIISAESRAKKTEPPPHLTEATLLTGMETAGKTLEDRDLAEFMLDSGLGTPATRAGVIETLLSRNYLLRKGKSLVATPLGHKLIATVHPSVKSPELTARWEQLLSEIQSRKTTLAEFMVHLEREVTARIAEIGKNPPASRPPQLSQSLQSLQPLQPPHAPQAMVNNFSPRVATPVGQIQELLKKHFGFETFRKGQEEVCRTVTSGQDVLLVMPTGAGKSLCYQLPGIARGGTTLVVSPLLALIEDQIAKLQALNFSADRIHSGRTREESRQVCLKYLAGELDFLFIAPERLSVPGFPEFLVRRLPTLIAIDEAHCISQWGHDFRPDYRILGERLTSLRPAPVIALTATATPAVQDDICRQLGLKSETRIIQGFRRTNIGIEVVDLSPSARPDAVLSILKKQNRLPAIVYAPTRKKTDELTEKLSKFFRVGSYHAGMSTQGREKVQSEFLNNDLDVMVATVAFGMGIDKANIRTVIHAAMPASVEGYYQEIGRAGRDGAPSKAFLLYSFVDQKTHEFFFELNYPDAAKLQALFLQLSQIKIPKSEIQKRFPQLDSAAFDRTLEQLWVHGGLLIDSEENLCRGSDLWEKSYHLQRNLKQNQLKQMLSFATSGKCRMVHLVSHFGDQHDSGKPCGQCDLCQPQQADSLTKQRFLSPGEQQTAKEIFRLLDLHSGLATGKLFHFIEESKNPIARGDFEKLLAALERARYLESKETSFEKDGQNITYRKLSLLGAGRSMTANQLSSVEISGLQASLTKKSSKRPVAEKRSKRRKNLKGAKDTKRKSKSNLKSKSKASAPYATF